MSELITWIDVFGVCYSGIERLRLRPSGDLLWLCGAWALRVLRLPWNWTGEIAVDSCGGLRDLSMGCSRLLAGRSDGVHANLMRYSGRGASLDYSVVLGEEASFAERRALPQLRE